VPRQLDGRAGLTWKRRLGDLAVVAIAFGVGAAALSGYTTFRIWQVGSHDTARHADAIVVLGAAQYNGRPSAVLAARLDHAIDLYKAGNAPFLFVTGGKLQGDRTTEAATGRAYAIKRGVPASAILSESTGSSTLESIRNVKAVFDARGLHSAVFVSDRGHMLRVLLLAEDAGIEGWASPTDTSPDDTDPQLRWDSTLHELGALGLYLLVGQEGATTATSATTPNPSAPAATHSSANPMPTGARTASPSLGSSAG
jgi:uncharacterized SAM-binding protein YcdF (DUF218 family)